MRKIPLATGESAASIRAADVRPFPDASASVLTPDLGHNPLSLPALHPDIPYRFDQTLRAPFLNLGKRLLRMGVEMHDDPDKDIAEIIETGMLQVLQQVCEVPDLPCLYVTMETKSSLMYQTEEIEEGYVGLTFALSLDEAPAYLMPAALYRLKQKNPALAWYFWSALEKASTLVPILTPSWFLSMVEHYEWMGFEDESEYMEEMYAQGAEPEDIQVVKRKDVMLMLQPWTLRACASKPQTVRKHLHAETLDPKGTQLCKLLDACVSLSTEITATDIHREGHSLSGHQFAVIPFMDSGERGGLFYQILDMAYRDGMENGEDDFLFRVSLDPLQDEANDHVFTHIGRVAQLWKTIQRIFDLTGEPL